MRSELFSQNGLGLAGITWKGISVATCEHPIWSKTHCALVYSSRATLLSDTLQCASCSLPLPIRYNSNARSSLSLKCSITDCSLLDTWGACVCVCVEPALGKRSSRPAESITGYHTAAMNWCGNAVRSSTQKPVSDHAICTSRWLLPAGACCCSVKLSSCEPQTASPEALSAVAFLWQWLHAHSSCGVGWSRLGLNGVISGWGELSSQSQAAWAHVAQEMKRLPVSALSIPCIHLDYSLISLCWFYGTYPHILSGLFG